jgi:hypothetical protein
MISELDLFLQKATKGTKDRSFTSTSSFPSFSSVKIPALSASFLR